MFKTTFSRNLFLKETKALSLSLSLSLSPSQRSRRKRKQRSLIFSTYIYIYIYILCIYPTNDLNMWIVSFFVALIFFTLLFWEKKQGKPFKQEFFSLLNSPNPWARTQNPLKSKVPCNEKSKNIQKSKEKKERWGVALMPCELATKLRLDTKIAHQKKKDDTFAHSTDYEWLKLRFLVEFCF